MPGAGTILITGVNTYTGATKVTGGTLALSALVPLPPGTYDGVAASSGIFVATGATFDVSQVHAGTANGTAGVDITTLGDAPSSPADGTVSIGKNLLIVTHASTTFSGVIQDGGLGGGVGGTLAIENGTQTLAGVNTYTGGTLVTPLVGGHPTLALTGTGSIADSNLVGISAFSTFDISQTTAGASIKALGTHSGSPVAGFGTVSLGSQTLTITNGLSSQTFQGVIQDGGIAGGTGGSLVISGGTQNLSGTNTYTGLTTINSGATLALKTLGTTNGSIATSSGVVDNGTFNISGLTNGGTSITTLSGTSTTAAVILGANTLTLSNASGTFAGVISGTGGLTLTAGAETLTGANTYAGVTTITAGTLQLGNGGTSGSIVGDVVDNGTLVFDRSDIAPAFAGAISGTGGVNQIGTGTTTLSAANTYTGATTVSAGTLQGGVANAFSATSATTVDTGGTLDLGGFTQVINSVSLAGGTLQNGTLTGAVTSTGGTISDLAGSASVTTTAGTTIALGTNTYTGGTTITGGTLQIGNGGTSGSITGDVTDNGTLAFDRSDSLTFAGAISGTGAVSQIGTGTTILSAASTYTGATTVNAGILQGGAADVFSATSATTVNTGGTLDLGGFAQAINNVSLAGGTLQNGALTGAVASTGGTISGLSGPASVTASAGTTTLLGTNAYTGATTVNGGTVQGGAANVFSATSATAVNTGGTLDLGGFAQTINAVSLAGGTLQNGSLAGAVTSTGGTISGLSGSASVTTTAGTTTLQGANAYTGATNINGGVFDVIGTLSGSNVVVNSGGTLGGSGSISDPTINAGGTLAPGNPATGPGTLSTGPLTFMPGSFYSIRITPTASDSTAVTGAASLGGATVKVTAGSGTYTPNTKYTILSATGGLGGTTFNSTVESNLTFLAPTLSYDTDDAYLTLTSGSPIGPSGTPDYRLAASNINQFAVASGLTTAAAANGGTGPILVALDNTTLPGAQSAFDQLSGAGLAAAQNAAFLSNSLFMSTMTDQSQYWMEGGPDSIGVTTTAAPPPGALPTKKGPMLAPPPPRAWRAWFTGFGGGQNIDANGALGSAGQTNTVYGGALGIDYQIQPNLLAGVAGGFSNSPFNVGALSTSGHVDGAHFGAYGVATFGSFYVQGAAAYTSADNHTTRNVAGFGGLLPGADNGSFHSQEVRGRLEVGDHFDFSGARLTPFAALEAANLWSGSFNESYAGGSPLYGLAVQDRSQVSLPGSLGLRAEQAFNLQGMTLSGSLSLAWVHEFDPEREIYATLISLPGASWQVNAAQVGANAAQVKAGVQMALNPMTVIFANFDGEFSGSAQSYTGKAGVRVSW